MSNIKAYCLNCHESVEPQSKQTVVLANNSRALKGDCPKCHQEVYRFMPKKNRFVAEDRRNGDKNLKQKYPDAWCFKCEKFTPTKNQALVLMENNRVAVQGQCSCCGSAVSRVLGKKDMSKRHTNLQLVHSKQNVKKRAAPPPPPVMIPRQAPAPTELPRVLRRNSMPGWAVFTLSFLTTFSVLLVLMDLVL